jgi:hypothetical protein
MLIGSRLDIELIYTPAFCHDPDKDTHVFASAAGQNRIKISKNLLEVLTLNLNPTILLNKKNS